MNKISGLERVSFWLPHDVVDVITRMAKAEGISRSTLLRQIALEAVGESTESREAMERPVIQSRRNRPPPAKYTVEGLMRRGYRPAAISSIMGLSYENVVASIKQMQMESVRHPATGGSQ